MGLFSISPKAPWGLPFQLFASFRAIPRWLPHPLCMRPTQQMSNPLGHADLAPWLSACQNAGGRVLFWMNFLPFIRRNKLKTNRQVSQMTEKSYHNSLPSKLFSLDAHPKNCGPSPSLSIGESHGQVSLDLIWTGSLISQFDPEFLTDLEKYQLFKYKCLLECFNMGF